MNIRRGLDYLVTAASALPSSTSRRVLLEAWRIERSLPRWFAAEPLPQLMQHLDEESRVPGPVLDRDSLTRLADAAVGLDYASPLGTCLRRSLVRYVLLRRAGVGAVVHFGARKEAGGGRSRIAGHAWLTLDGRPYAEQPENYQGFAVVYSYPAVENTGLSQPAGSLQPSLPTL
jgi:Transglutaminase-like superfamily